MLSDVKGQTSALQDATGSTLDRKSTRLNSSHTVISYAVFCLKKKNILVSLLGKNTILNVEFAIHRRRDSVYLPDAAVQVARLALRLIHITSFASNAVLISFT